MEVVSVYITTRKCEISTVIWNQLFDSQDQECLDMPRYSYLKKGQSSIIVYQLRPTCNKEQINH